MNTSLSTTDTKYKKKTEQTNATTAVEQRPIARPQPPATNENEVAVISRFLTPISPHWRPRRAISTTTPALAIRSEIHQG